MEQYGDMMAGAGIAVYIVIALFVVLIAWGTYKIIKRGKTSTDSGLPKETYEEISEQIKPDVPKTDDEVRIGAGKYNCICFRKILGLNVADFTKINKPVGELYQFDTSCPITGNGYIVMQAEDGSIIDYDPRQLEYNVRESPEYAYFAIDWSICNHVFFVPKQWYKSSSVWFAAGMMVMTFVVSLAIIG